MEAEEASVDSGLPFQNLGEFRARFQRQEPHPVPVDGRAPPAAAAGMRPNRHLPAVHSLHSGYHLW